MLSENNSSAKPSEQSHLNEIRGFHDDFYLRWNFQSRDLSYDSSMNNFDMKKYLYSTSPYALSTSYYRPNHASGGMLREGIKTGRSQDNKKNIGGKTQTRMLYRRLEAIDAALSLHF